MKLNDRKWKQCKLSKLGKIESGKDIYAVERIEGDIPYVTSGSQNNGIGYFVANKNKTLDKGYIAFNRNGAVGLAFYHPYWSVMGNDCRKIHILKADENIYVGLFISTAISMQSKSFSYSRKLGTARANKLQVMLPVDDNDEPDYQFMEDYMKELMVAKRKQYQEYVKQHLDELKFGGVILIWNQEIGGHFIFQIRKIMEYLMFELRFQVLIKINLLAVKILQFRILHVLILTMEFQCLLVKNRIQNIKLTEEMLSR